MKSILCFGDSNTYGYIPGTGGRYPSHIRWPRVLARLLGPEWEVVEEGLNGRITAFRDLIEPFRCGVDTLLPIVMSHEPLDSIVIMLGTNDTKDRFHVSAHEIGYGLETLLQMIFAHYLGRTAPDILVVAPVPLGDMRDGIEFSDLSRKKSLALVGIYEDIARNFGCAFLDVGSLGITLGEDCIHFTPQDHRNLAQAVANLLNTV